ncbi:MAG: DUF4367 domain-containing protein [Dorea sp.]|jgi:hypothetical protein|nr:DUF4367 domain-containing protein [Dorea sp.]
MKENMDQLEQALKKEFYRAAKKEETSILEDDSLDVPEGMKESLFAGINEKIKVMKQEDLYANMSEEDKKALEIGRRIMEEEAKEEFRVKIVRKKRRFRMYIGLAAALVLAMAVGVTSLGGPERIIRMLTQMVGDREVVQVDSSDDNKVIVKEEEEEAYQKVREEFGVDPVRIFWRPRGMKFIKMQLDEEMRIAEINFKYNEESIVYWINASYAKSSWGIDVEDNVTEKYTKEINDCLIEIKEYEILQTKAKRYSASFRYNGLEYFIMGKIQKEEFEEIINNLYFHENASVFK